jgi:hypothetical protein
MKRFFVVAMLLCAVSAGSAVAKESPTYSTAVRVAHATLQVINDVGQRREAADPNDPRIWTPSYTQVEKDAKLWKKEIQQLGPLETPKKSWLDADMATLQRWVDVLNKEVTAQGSGCPAETTAALADLNKSFADLQGLTAGPTYDNLKIAAAALSVRDQAKKIQSCSRSAKKK